MNTTTETRRTDWFLTKTGIMFFPLEPYVREIEIEDIAHALSQLCRFGGHCNKFYSVAQHSCVVSQNLPDSLKFQGLMHDATEAYCGDLIRPIKYSIKGYVEMEEKLWCAICERFGMPTLMDPRIKHADNRALMTERRDLLKDAGYAWSLSESHPPFDQKIIPIPPLAAKCEFLSAFDRLKPLHNS
jgi:5'-deoxynucleotidase YfbR-like HD superfamily hydrolase